MGSCHCCPLIYRHFICQCMEQLAEPEESVESAMSLWVDIEKQVGNLTLKVKDVYKRQVYYYSNANMSDNYARIAMLVEEKNLPKTIAEMVRFSCKTYPSPTPLDYFTPVSYTHLDVYKRQYSYPNH